MTKNLKKNLRTINYIKIILNFKYGVTAFEKKINHRFLRVHRSYIINSDKITAYTKNDIEIENIEIPIGDFYKNEALKKLNKSLN